MKVYTFEQIGDILEYRSPMALLDKIVENESKWIAVKNISFNELVFEGHFPGHPIMPGVLQVEAMEQFAEFVLRVQGILDPAENKILLAKKLRKVKFRKPALPGDRLVMELEIKGQRDEEVDVAVQCKTNSGLVSQAEITMGLFNSRVFDRGIEPFCEWDKNAEIAMDVNKIMSIIPHRYPFLFVDYITKLDGNKVYAVKNVTGSEPYFDGHSVSTATVPVSFMSEIVAQAGCVLTLSKPSNQGKIAYFMSIDEAECIEPAVPGDQLRIEVDVPEGSSRFGKGEGLIKIGDKVISRTVMTFAVVDK